MKPACSDQERSSERAADGSESIALQPCAAETPSSEEPILRTIDLWKEYTLEAGTVKALRGASLGIRTGEFVAVMGPSGSGKSTLLNILGCLDRPTAGSYFLGGVDVSLLGDDELSELFETAVSTVAFSVAR